MTMAETKNELILGAIPHDDSISFDAPEEIEALPKSVRHVTAAMWRRVLLRLSQMYGYISLLVDLVVEQKSLIGRLQAERDKAITGIGELEKRVDDLRQQANQWDAVARTLPTVITALNACSKPWWTYDELPDWSISARFLDEGFGRELLVNIQLMDLDCNIQLIVSDIGNIRLKIIESEGDQLVLHLDGNSDQVLPPHKFEQLRVFMAEWTLASD